ncbi:MAG: DHH family phosphoesterase [Methylococcaceae bacterium]|nr:DHH family phosphoesterase [Methylococcaceae bacterium]
MNYDIFNGDADGICALIQLRLAQPKKTVLVTGIKRDIQLLKKIDAQAGDHLTVLDISLQKNNEQVIQCLNNGAHIFYADHHQAGEIPKHPNFNALINTDPNTCTSLIINQHLQGKYPLWAITAAYGDNLQHSADQLADTLGLDSSTRAKLKNLGIYINYNGYGSCIEDLHFAPDKLYQELMSYTSPLDFITENQGTFKQLENGYLADMQRAAQTSPHYQTESVAVYKLPDETWAKRVSGVFGNDLANQYPDRAHAILTDTSAGDYQVSVRAPLNNKTKADALCASFPTGGGRKAAAGINHLPLTEVTRFIEKFNETYSNMGLRI